MILRNRMFQYVNISLFQCSWDETDEAKLALKNSTNWCLRPSIGKLERCARSSMRNSTWEGKPAPPTFDELNVLGLYKGSTRALEHSSDQIRSAVVRPNVYLRVRFEQEPRMFRMGQTFENISQDFLRFAGPLNAMRIAPLISRPVDFCLRIRHFSPRAWQSMRCFNMTILIAPRSEAYVRILDESILSLKPYTSVSAQTALQILYSIDWAGGSPRFWRWNMANCLMKSTAFS